MDDLIAQLEAATGPDRELDAAIKELVGHAWDYAADWGMRGNEKPVALPYTASIDAALTLVPEGWLMRLVSFAKGSQPTPVSWRCVLRTWLHSDDGEVAFSQAIGVAPTPALAIVIAALRLLSKRPSRSPSWNADGTGKPISKADRTARPTLS